MSIQYTFPFCIISDFGTQKTVSGSVTVTDTVLGISNTVYFTLPTTTWGIQVANSAVVLDMPDNFLYESWIKFDITCTIDDSECLALILEPTLTHPYTLDAYLIPKRQEIANTDFLQINGWHNLPLRNTQLAHVELVTHVEETEKTVIESIAKKIKFRKTLTYVEAEPTKDNMSIVENIEYYLGKDRLKNLYFNADIPSAWDIPARILNPAPIVKVSSVGFFKGFNDTVAYYYNNLGYRSNFDYIKEELVDKPVIICLGDSDTFGIGVEYEKIWPNLLDTDAVVLNLSIPGIALDGLARIAVQTLQALNNVEAVLMHYPPMSLREFVSKKYKGGVHTHRNYNLPYKDWWEHIDWQSNNYNFNKNRLLLESASVSHGAKYFDLYTNREDKKVPYDWEEYGVYASIGPHTHQAIANYFNRKLKGQPSLFQTLQS
jgi:hypothetical protein